jgi:Flp pilus assembly protein TadG
MVEFALVLPLFILVFSGICDFGSLLYSRMSVINASREGARAAIMVSDYSTIETVADGEAKSVAASGGMEVTDVETTCYVGSSTATRVCADVITGDTVSVTVSYSYHTFFPLMFGAVINLSSTVQMIIDNPS